MTEEQARLLQIGDKLKVVCKDDDINKAVIVTEIRNSSFDYNFVELSEFTEYNQKDYLFQIPLTDEILGKNGFSINVFENCIYYDFPKNAGFDELIKANYHLIKYNSDDYYFFEDCPFIKVKTVDEFQRLLRLMGFVDFTNNIKV